MSQPGAAVASGVRAELIEERTLLRLVLDRPKGNVLDAAMMEGLEEALDRHVRHPDLRLVLLRGAGGHFSFGASVEEHRRDEAPRMLANFHRLVRKLAAYPVPVAALIEGQCLGGAFELALCCHFVFATPGARLGTPEIRLGVFPPVLAAIGAQRLGGAVAERLLLSGEPITAERARDLGFVAEIVSGDPDEAVLEWYRRTLIPLSAFALRQGTRAARQASGMLQRLDRALEEAERQYLSEVLESHDGNEGIAAFLERRPPVWRNR